MHKSAPLRENLRIVRSRLLVKENVLPEMLVPLNMMSVLASPTTDPASAPTPVTLPLMTLRSMFSCRQRRHGRP
jgi:hypothetical protein